MRRVIALALAGGFLLTLFPACAAPINLAFARQGMARPGVPITLRLTQTLVSGQAKEGAAVTFAVAQDAADGQGVTVSAGTAAFGTVRKSQGAGAFGRPGRLEVSCDYLLLPDGRHLAVRAPGTLSRMGHDGSGAAGITGVLVGGVVGAAVYAGSDISHNVLNDHPDNTTPAVTGLLVGVGSGLLVGALFRGGNVALKEGQTVTAEIAP